MFSIVIPFYNTKPTVFDRLLKSIEKQTVKPAGLELIIIDDCSCRKYRPKVSIDIKYTIIRNRRNHGPGYSRQRGINYTHNDYILFMDSDDEFYSENAFAHYIEGIGQNPDIIYAKYIRVFHRLQVRNVYHVDIWGQCFRKQFLIDNHICFQPLHYGEDLLFSLEASQKTTNIYQMDSDIIVQYHDNVGSLTHTNPTMFGILLAMDLLVFMRYAYENNFDIDVVNQTLQEHLSQIRHVDVDYVGFFFVLSCYLGGCIYKYCPLAEQLYVIKDEKAFRQAECYIWKTICEICKQEKPKKQKILKRHFKKCLSDGKYLRRIL